MNLLPSRCLSSMARWVPPLLGLLMFWPPLSMRSMSILALSPSKKMWVRKFQMLGRLDEKYLKE